MTINIISDIHATLDKHNNVIYNLPFMYKHNKYIKTAECLREYWRSHVDEIKKLQFDFRDLYITFPETILLKTHEDVLPFIDKLCNAVKKQFNGITRDEMFAFSGGMSSIDRFCVKHNIKWHHKAGVLSLSQLSRYMFKCLYDFDPSKLAPADVLIIAGDLGLEPIYDMVLDDIKAKTAGKFKKVLSIAGNHDHWWWRVPGISDEKPDHPNFDHDYCEWTDGDYAFIGCTMWTPIPERYVWSVGRYMNDYRYTPGKFSPYASSHQYKIQSAWLRSKLAKYAGKKIVVFTHHQPFEELCLDDYEHSDVNAAYVVLDHSLDDISSYGDIKLWACGHTHQNFDGVLHGIHVVRNPIGYRDVTGISYDVPENLSDTWYNKIVEV